MAAITASMVAELRGKTDAPMMECKKALTEADGDMAKAEELLRVKLGTKAGKAASRITAEGVVASYIDGAKGALVEVNSETDFVSKNDSFMALAKAAADKGLDADAVLAELAALQRSDAVPEAASPSALIDHILARYHEVHRQQLPELIRMARRVEAVHRDHPQVPVGLADHLEAMHEELLSACDMLLSPLSGGNGDFNHLSVRTAAGAMLDRFFGWR